MKLKLKILILLLSILAQTSFASKPDSTNINIKEIPLNVISSGIKNGNSGKPNSRMPKHYPVIGTDNNTIYLFGQFEDCTIQILQGDEVIVQVFAPSQSEDIPIPCLITGLVEIKIDDGQYTYSGNIIY